MFFQNPDVAELKWVTVALKLDRSRCSLGIPSRAACFSRDFKILVDGDTVETNRDLGILDLFAIFGPSVGEVDVVGLPREWRKTCIQVRVLDGVYSSALVVHALQTEGVKNLNLEMVYLVKTAVPTALSASRWAVGEKEFKVHVIVVEFSFGADVGAIGVE